MESIYREMFAIRAAECDNQGRMRVSALFITMQEGAEKNAEALGAGRCNLWSQNLFFALSRIRVEIKRLPRIGETVIHETWPGIPNHFFYPRFHRFLLENGTVLAAAASLWVTMDRNERRIVTPAAAGLIFPDTSTVESPCAIPGRIQEPSLNALAFESISQYEDLDINGHVNNARYISWLCNALGMRAFENACIRTLVVSYDKEIRGTQRIKHLIRYENGTFAYRVTDDIGEKCFSASGEIGVEK